MNPKDSTEVVPNPDLRSQKARDRTLSSIATAIKIVREENNFFNVLRPLIGKYKIHLLVVANHSYRDQGRKANFGPQDKGKPAMVGIPTGGSEANEATDHVAERETEDESGYPINRTICRLTGFTQKKQIPGRDPEKYHPHFLNLIDVDPDMVHEIKEKKEIKRSWWATLCEIIERLRLGKIALDKKRTDPEAFYFSHAKNFIFPFFFEVYYMTDEEISSVKDTFYREWLTKFKPYIVEELDEHRNDIIELKLVPEKYIATFGNSEEIVPDWDFDSQDARSLE